MNDKQNPPADYGHLQLSEILARWGAPDSPPCPPEFEEWLEIARLQRDILELQSSNDLRERANEARKTEQREWLARQYEKSLAPNLIDALLATRAQEYFEALVVEYAPAPVLKAFDGAGGADATLVVRRALQGAYERAIRATAAALREGKLG